MKLTLRSVWIIFVLLATASLAAQQSASTTDAERVKQRFVGSFKLISWTQYDANGTASKSPYIYGQISYDAAGRMAANLMTEERRTMAAARGNQAGQPGARGTQGAQGRGQGGDNITGYISYYGRFEVDPARGIVTHFVEGSSNLGMIDTPQVRYYELTPDGKTLFLSTKSGERVTGRLQWDRY